MKRVVELLAVSVIILSCSSATKNTINGFWYDSYPLNDSSGGYLFYPQGEFVYFHPDNKNMEHRYWGSSGEWQINNDAIEIKMLKHYYLERPVQLQNAPSGKYAVGINNPIKYLKVIKPEWELIGYMQDYRVALFENDMEAKILSANTLELPSILLAQINNGKIAEKVKYYNTQDAKNTSADVKGNINIFRNAKKGSKNEWSPGNPYEVIE
jgi:hypothetical protein